MLGQFRPAQAGGRRACRNDKLAPEAQTLGYVCLNNRSILLLLSSLSLSMTGSFPREGPVSGDKPEDSWRDQSWEAGIDCLDEGRCHMLVC